jgi:multiple sugar transport system permease protein
MSTTVLPDSERIDPTHTKAPTMSGRPPGRKRKTHWLPYALVAPAILFELLIHIVPMLTGIWISFIQLTKYFIANWGAAPFAGFRNYQVVVDFDQAIGRGVLNSFLITCAFTVLVVGLSWPQPWRCRSRSPDAGSSAPCSSCPTRCRCTPASSPGSSCSSGTPEP